MPEWKPIYYCPHCERAWGPESSEVKQQELKKCARCREKARAARKPTRKKGRR